MPELKTEQLVRYMGSLLGEQVRLLDVVVLGHSPSKRLSRDTGMGHRSAVDYELADHQAP